MTTTGLRWRPSSWAAWSARPPCAGPLPVSGCGFRDTSLGRALLLRWEFGDGESSLNRSVDYAWSAPGFYEVTLWVSDGERASTAKQVFLVEAAAPLGFCVADAETLCLQDSRYAVAVEWRTADGRSGPGSVVHAGTNDSGLFTFFSRENWEILIKVLDGCALNGHVWVYGVDDGPRLHDPGDRHGDGRGEGVRERAGSPGGRDHGRDGVSGGLPAVKARGIQAERGEPVRSR